MINRSLVRIALSTALVLALVLVPTALAGKGKPGGGTTGGGGSLGLVLLDSSDGLPHWGQNVTFNVSTTATTRPYVTLDCHQGGAWVSSMTAGFFPDYPWGQVFGLSSSSWASGAADCTADLHYSNRNGRKVTLATLTFHVYA